MNGQPSVVHIYHNPTGARLFSAPMVRRLISAGIPTELWCDGAPCSWFGASANAKDPEVPVRNFPSDLSLNPLRLFSRVVRLFSALRKTRPQVVHSHLLRSALLPLLAAKLAGVPVRIYHNHGLSHLGYDGILRFLLLLLERLNRALATHVLMVSESNRDAALAEGLHGPNMTVIAHGSAVGLSLSAFAEEYCGPAVKTRERARLGIGSDDFVVGYAGRAAAHKGIGLLVQAWAISQLARTGGRLLLAGVTKQDLKRLTHTIPAGVHCLGPLTDMPSFYATCDLVVLASRYEGFGYALLEAAAAGLPTIGSDVPGIRCAIIHDQTGLLVPTGDVDSLATALSALASNPELRRSMGSNARRRTSERFRDDVVLDALVAYYRETLGVEARNPR